MPNPDGSFINGFQESLTKVIPRMEAATWEWRDWVCSNLGVTEEQVLGVYTIGSQAFGTATPTSGVLGHGKESEVESLWEWHIEKDGIDCTVYEKGFWLSQLDEQQFLCVMCQYFLPPHVVGKRSQEVFPYPFRLELQRFKLALYSRIDRQDNQARRLFVKDLRRSKKSFLHSLRQMMLTLELVKTGEMKSFEAAKGLYYEVMYTHYETFSDLQAWYKAHMDPLMEELKELTNGYKLSMKTYEEPPNAALNNKSFSPDKPLRMTSYLRDLANLVSKKEEPEKEADAKKRIGEQDQLFDLLKREISMTIYRPSEDTFPNLVQFIAHLRFASPKEFTPTRESCGGLVLDAADSWTPICIPHAKVFDYTDEKESEYWPLDDLDLSTTKVYRWPVGVPVTLYWYKDRWLLSSSRNGSVARVLYRNLREKIRQEEKREIEEKDWMKVVEKKFWSVWEREAKAKGYTMPTDITKCYMFKLGLKGCQWEGEENVLAPVERITLTGVRDMKTRQELPPEGFAEEHHWRCIEEVKELSPSVSPQAELLISKGDMEVVKDRCEELNRKLLLDYYHKISVRLSALLWQGFMLVDNNFTRLRITSQQYHSLNKLHLYYRKLSDKQRYVFTIMRTSFLSPELFCGFYPEWEQWYMHVRNEFIRLCEEMDEVWHSMLAKVSHQEFKQLIKRKPLTKVRLNKVWWGLKTERYKSTLEYYVSEENNHPMAQSVTANLLEFLFKGGKPRRDYLREILDAIRKKPSNTTTSS